MCNNDIFVVVLSHKYTNFLNIAFIELLPEKKEVAVFQFPGHYIGHDTDNVW